MHARLPGQGPGGDGLSPGLKALQGLYKGLLGLPLPLPVGHLEVGHTLGAGGVAPPPSGLLNFLPPKGLHQSPGRGG